MKLHFVFGGNEEPEIIMGKFLKGEEVPASLVTENIPAQISLHPDEFSYTNVKDTKGSGFKITLKKKKKTN
jgi:hypothetical protein